MAELSVILAEIWADVLAVPEVKPNDDFFRLGGDSLQAVELMTHIHERFNLQLDPIEVFESPRFEAFVRCVERLRSPAEEGVEEGAF